MEPAAASQLVLFIPDISGFTKFVAETEINHSQHIIRELLEILVDSNSIGLKISEIEGDAILFFRPGAPPSAAEFVEQARKMFVNFHTQLKRYELQRLCQCGACTSASQLTLKIVAHRGPASTVQIRDHTKLIGKDVIVAHRLLKNSLQQREYLLLTRDLLAGLKESNGGLEAIRRWRRLVRRDRRSRIQVPASDQVPGGGQSRKAGTVYGEKSAQGDGAVAAHPCARRAGLPDADRSSGTDELDRGHQKGRAATTANPTSSGRSTGASGTRQIRKSSPATSRSRTRRSNSGKPT